jgi:hypothetical protein
MECTFVKTTIAISLSPLSFRESMCKVSFISHSTINID